MPKITELLFDCDNTLVLSEELAFEACAGLANEILEKHGKTERYTGDQLIKDFVGQNFRGMMVNLQKIHDFQMEPDEFEGYVKEEENAVIKKLLEKGQPCVGANEELQKLYDSKKYGMAVVSSSALRRVKASIEKVGQDQYFSPDHIFSAATSLGKPTSKPDPAVYLHAMKVIGVQPEECIAVEDSKSGALAAVRAGIHTIAYVGSYHGEQKQKEVAKMLTDLGAKYVMWTWADFPECLAKVEAE
ncbi:putative had superfamily [Phaeomoniella chlamydospora]|uniref:Putative had superfamily n=1 Tax=Phaeomoniella chlamydospora TaxID=158046 RepID=A0A0G2HFF0_PHACM|nr:putative had superfamily [Phaeomoniella chlamydospora]